MSGKNRLGDRRENLRFDISGQLWASLDFGDRVIVRNLTAGGMLVETSLTSAFKPIRAAQVAFEERRSPITVIVRHVSPALDPGANRFLVGLEFVNLSPSQQVELERLVSEWQSDSQGHS
jgi:c-di-GMP-binding flagellar brake protein YcgR